MNDQRYLRWVRGALLLVVSAMACEERLPIEPLADGTSWLALVTLIDAPLGVEFGDELSYEVREVSGTVGIDTVIVTAPLDTLTLRVPPATYEVRLAEVRPNCSSRLGFDQQVFVPNPPSTAIARYRLTCRAPLTIEVLTDGFDLDDSYVYRVDGEASSVVGSMTATDTVLVDSLTSGAHEVSLAHISEHCTVTSNGGRCQRVTIAPEGGARVVYRIRCSNTAEAPSFVRLHTSYSDGVSAVRFVAADPDLNIERYVWDLTDCTGTSIRSDQPLSRRGLSQGRTARRDTVSVVSAFEVDLPDSVVIGRCVSLRVEDEHGNTTPVVERLITKPVGRAPTATLFNAFSVGTEAIRTELRASDPDDDYVGVFVAAEMRDGILAPPDGNRDVGVYNSAGYLETDVPDLRFNGTIKFGDVYAIWIYLIDDVGNVTKVVDANTLR